MTKNNITSTTICSIGSQQYGVIETTERNTLIQLLKIVSSVFTTCSNNLVKSRQRESIQAY